MVKPSGFIALILAAGLANSAFSSEQASEEHWTRAQALESAASTDTAAYRQQLNAELRSGDNAATLLSLQQLVQHPDLSAPAREKLLYDYVTDLRQEPPAAVSKDVMAFLQNYTSTVLVEDEDHPRSMVPMFNIKSAASGVQNHWNRQEAAYQGAVHLANGAQTLVNAYLDAGEMPERSGLMDALSTATPAQLAAVTELAMGNIDARPEAFALAATSALKVRDTAALRQLVAGFENPEMAHLLQRSVEVLNPQQASQLLNTALSSGSATTASLAIAILTPALAGDEATESLLFETLADADLGSSAAIALARSASPQTLLELQDLANSDKPSLQASRARMALEIHNTQLDQEDRQ